MSGGTLDADETSTVSGALTQTADITIDVATGKTLSYTGAAVNLGAKSMTLSGGGTLSNTNALVLNNADSLLSLAGILTIGDVDGTTASNTGKGIEVISSATLGDYDLSAESYLAIAASQTLAGQLNLKTNGELKTSGDGQYIGDIELAGGKFSATDNQVLGGTLSITADSELTVSQGYTLTLSQNGGLVLGGNALTISGGGSFVSGVTTLNDADSKLLLNSITLDSANTTADSLGLDIDANSTVTALSVGHITPISIATDKSLSGAIAVTAGSIKLNETGTLASTVTMSGGTLDADKNLTVSGALTQTADIVIDVAPGMTLTYSGAAVNLGAKTLTLSGGGTLSNTNALVLNNADSLLSLDDSLTVELASVTVGSNVGKGLAVNESSTISSLKVTANTELNVAQGKVLSGSTEVAAATTLNLSGTGTFGSALNLLGTLEAGANLTVSGLISVGGNSAVSIPANTTLTYTGGDLNVGAYSLSIGGAGTFSNDVNSPLVLDVADSILDLSGTGTITGPLKLESGTLKASAGSPTISGALTQYDDATIEVAANQTLNYSGASLNLGANKLSLIGGGTLANTNALVLNNADSLLSLAGILTIGDIDGTTSSNSGKGIEVTSSATMGDYDLSAVSYLSLAANQTLAGQLNLKTNGELKTSGAGQYIGDIALAGGKFSATDNQVLGGTLSVTADSELTVSQGYTLTLSQNGGLVLGGNALTISGGGSLVSGGVTLNNADSKLLLNSITLDSASTTADSLGLDVDANSTVTALSVGHITPISIATGKTLSGAITVTAGSLKLTETGTLASTVTMSGGTLDADETLTVSGALSHSGNITIDVATGKTLTYSGAAVNLGAKTLTLIGGGNTGQH